MIGGKKKSERAEALPDLTILIHHCFLLPETSNQKLYVTLP